MWARRFHALPVRGKLLALVLLPLVVVLPLLGVALLAWASVALDRLLITKVRADLAVAHGYFERVLGEVAAHATAAAESHALHRVLAAGAPPDAAALVALLRDVKARDRLDFVNLRDVDGRLRVTDHGLATPADDDPAPPAYGGRGAAASVEVLAPAALARLAPALQSRVPVPLVATRNAAPADRDVEDRAMVVLANAPVRAADGRLLGWIQAGTLLNRNLDFIDHINDIVYPAGSLPFGSRGTATLFLDDVRISTNVRLFDAAGADGDSRAIGTRVSRQVRDAVLGRGSTWLDRAFVVSDWYVSAYQPIADAEGRRVGMLYVGFLERPFVWVKYGALAGIGVLFFAVVVGAALVSLRGARAIFAPVERMASTMAAVERGDARARVGPVASGDEIGELARHLDRLLDTVDANTRELRRFNAELDAKVAARTRELQAAQQQLVRAEKLAAVGQLTAGVAHEINNPIAVIQGNLDLLRDLLGPAAQPVAAEMKLLDEQVERMRLIVTRLLQFARPNEFAGYVEAVDPGRVVDDSLVLVGPQLAKAKIAVRRRFEARRRPAINAGELQQVVVNLLVNAIHAMPDGGTLTLATRDAGDDGVEIEVADTGPGLGADLIGELFQPFVTRKKDGTGLGLWISRSIVERYGGDLRAADRSDGRGGAVFTVALKVEPAAEPAAA